MNKSKINVPSVGTEVDSNSTAQNHSVSQPNANTNVVGIPFQSREFKFRGQDEYGVWVYGSLVNNLWEINKQSICEIVTNGRNYFDCWQDMIDNENIVEVKAETVGQYTGLKDKNGKDIYEGDIFKGREQTTLGHPLKEGLFACVWEDSGFIAKQIDGKSCDCWLYFFETNIQSRPLTECEIIGNVYENPELLHSVA